MTGFRDALHAAGKAIRKQRRADAVAHLRDAEALAARAGDWADLAAQWARLGADDAPEARRCAERALAHPVANLAVHHGVAKVYASQLCDPAAARDALDRWRATCEAQPPPLADWCDLATSYRLLLADPAAAGSVLVRGLAHHAAPSIDDLCRLAAIHGTDLGDLATARTLIERAAVMIESEAPEHSHITSVHSAQRYTLGDLDAAWRTLERGVERASTFRGCLHMAASVAICVRDDPAHRPLLLAAIAKAATHATTVDDWLAVGDDWHAYRGSPEDIRHCLERALAGDPDAAARTRIAHGYRHWLDDAATADGLAPRGLAPTAMLAVRRRRDGWDADPTGLLDWLRARLTPASLRAISEADYGCQSERHLALLLDIHATGLIPQPLTLFPREVLSLFTGERRPKADPVARAFACTVLLIDTAGPKRIDSNLGVPADLIESCQELGEEAMTLAMGLLVALTEAFEDACPELTFAHLGLLVAAAARDPRDPRLPRLVEQLRESAVHASRHDFYRGDVAWLVDRTPSPLDARHAAWHRVSERHLDAPSRGEPLLAHLAGIAERVGAP